MDASHNSRETTLGECANWLSGGTPRKNREEFWGGDIPWASAKDMKEFRLYDTEDHITQLAIDEGARIAPQGAILILVRGMTLHNDVPLCVTMREMAFNQDVRAIVPKEGTDLNYLAYWLLAKKPMLLGLVDSAGHGTGRFHSDVLKALPIELPPLPQQRAIASILGAFDEKIELNRRMNETLESMAQALFKSWFIDFDPVRAKMRGEQPQGLPVELANLFPDELVDSELGPIPKGWALKPLYETAQYVNGAAFKSKDFCEADNGLPVVKIAELKSGISAQTKFSKKQIKETQVINTGDLLYSWSGSPETSLETFVWGGGKGLLNQHIFNVITQNDAQKHFVYYLLKHLRDTLVAIARDKQTTGLGHVTVADMKRLQVCLPPDDLIAECDATLGKFYEACFTNGIESRSLSMTRDTLLPQLLSGELLIPESLGKHSSV